MTTLEALRELRDDMDKMLKRPASLREPDVFPDDRAMWQGEGWSYCAQAVRGLVDRHVDKALDE